MKYFEKAIENYAKEMKKRYDLWLKNDILRYNCRIERMTADGKCPGDIECQFCPLRLANESEENLDVNCGEIKPEAVRHIIAMEVKE